MKRFVFLSLAVLQGCAPSAPVTSAPTAPATATTTATAPTPPAPPERVTAKITFVEKGPNVPDWDFVLEGFPAFDVTTGTVMVADISHGHIASSLSLVIRWFHPGYNVEAHAFAVLDPKEASHVLYDLDDKEAKVALPKLAAKVRESTKAANEAANEHTLRGMAPCKVAKYEGACTHPQRVTCGVRDLALDGDQLGATKLGWSVKPMTIGPGPPKEMLTCIGEAYYDPSSTVIVAHVEHACRGGGSDACFLPFEWRAATLR